MEERRMRLKSRKVEGEMGSTRARWLRRYITTAPTAREVRLCESESGGYARSNLRHARAIWLARAWSAEREGFCARMAKAERPRAEERTARRARDASMKAAERRWAKRERAGREWCRKRERRKVESWMESRTRERVGMARRRAGGTGWGTDMGTGGAGVRGAETQSMGERTDRGTGGGEGTEDL